MNIQFWLGKKNLGWLQLTGCLVAISFLFSTVATPFAQASLWEERKSAVADLKKSQEETLLAQLPSVQAPAFPTLNSLNHFKSHDLSSYIKREEIKIPNLEEINWVTSLPINIASLRKVSIPSGWKVGDTLVLYMQDAHLNEDAQKNIGKSVQHFINKGKLDLVALEGAFEPIDLTPFREFPKQDVVRKVADYLLKENEISGAVHTAFTSKKDIPSFVGVDDKEHYWANVEAYRALHPKVALYKEKHGGLVAQLKEEKLHKFNPELLDFDRNIEAYRAGKENLGSYVKLLVKELGAEKLGTVPNFSQVKIFLGTLKIEQSLDFKQVEKERSSIIENLVKNLSKSQMRELLNASLAYRMGTIQHTDFYLYIEDLAKKNGLEFEQFPTMGTYIRYLIASDKINAEKLFVEVAELEEKAYAYLAKTKEEKRLVEESKYLYLLGKLINSSLTRQEWDQYVQLGTAPYLLANRELSLISFENFYKESIIRDQKIASNVVRNIKDKNAQFAFLVTGGFHSDGIEAQLHKNNIAVVSYTPKISKVDTENGNAYLSVFTQEKTPLQKLFDGEKLFLPKEVLANSAQMEGSLATAVLGSETLDHMNRVYDGLNRADKGDILSAKEHGEDWTVEVKGDHGIVETTIDQENGAIFKMSGGEAKGILSFLARVKNDAKKVSQKILETLQSKTTQELILAASGALLVHIFISFYAPGLAGVMSSLTFLVLALADFKTPPLIPIHQTAENYQYVLEANDQLERREKEPKNSNVFLLKHKNKQTPGKGDPTIRFDKLPKRDLDLDEIRELKQIVIESKLPEKEIVRETSKIDPRNYSYGNTVRDLRRRSPYENKLARRLTNHTQLIILRAIDNLKNKLENSSFPEVQPGVHSKNADLDKEEGEASVEHGVLLGIFAAIILAFGTACNNLLGTNLPAMASPTLANGDPLLSVKIIQEARTSIENSLRTTVTPEKRKLLEDQLKKIIAYILKYVDVKTGLPYDTSDKMSDTSVSNIGKFLELLSDVKNVLERLGIEIVFEDGSNLDTIIQRALSSLEIAVNAAKVNGFTPTWIKVSNPSELSLNSAISYLDSGNLIPGLETSRAVYSDNPSISDPSSKILNGMNYKSLLRDSLDRGDQIDYLLGGGATFVSPGVYNVIKGWKLYGHSDNFWLYVGAVGTENPGHSILPQYIFDKEKIGDGVVELVQGFPFTAFTTAVDRRKKDGLHREQANDGGLFMRAMPLLDTRGSSYDKLALDEFIASVAFAYSQGYRWVGIEAAPDSSGSGYNGWGNMDFRESAWHASLSLLGLDARLDNLIIDNLTRFPTYDGIPANSINNITGQYVSRHTMWDLYRASLAIINYLYEDAAVNLMMESKTVKNVESRAPAYFSVSSKESRRAKAKEKVDELLKFIDGMKSQKSNFVAPVTAKKIGLVAEPSLSDRVISGTRDFLLGFVGIPTMAAEELKVYPFAPRSGWKHSQLYNREFGESPKEMGPIVGFALYSEYHEGVTETIGKHKVTLWQKGEKSEVVITRGNRTKTVKFKGEIDLKNFGVNGSKSHIAILLKDGKRVILRTIDLRTGKVKIVRDITGYKSVQFNKNGIRVRIGRSIRSYPYFVRPVRKIEGKIIEPKVGVYLLAIIRTWIVESTRSVIPDATPSTPATGSEQPQKSSALLNTMLAALSVPVVQMLNGAWWSDPTIGYLIGGAAVIVAGVAGAAYLIRQKRMLDRKSFENVAADKFYTVGMRSPLSGSREEAGKRGNLFNQMELSASGILTKLSDLYHKIQSYLGAVLGGLLVSSRGKIIWRFERHLLSDSEALVRVIEKALKKYTHVNVIFELSASVSTLKGINPALADKLGDINAYPEIIEDPQTRKEIEDFLREYWWHYVENRLASLREGNEVRFNPLAAPLFNYLGQHPEIHFYQEKVPVEAVLYRSAYEAALKQAEQSLYHSEDEALFTDWMFLAGYYFWHYQAYRDKKVASDVNEIITKAPPSSFFAIGRGGAHAVNLSSFIEEDNGYEKEVHLVQDWSTERYGMDETIMIKYRKDFETGESLPSSARKDLLMLFPYEWVSELMDSSKGDSYERNEVLAKIFHQMDEWQVPQLTQDLLSSRLAEFLENEQIGSKEGQPNYGRGFFTLMWLKRYGLLTPQFEDYLDPAVKESLNDKKIQKLLYEEGDERMTNVPDSDREPTRRSDSRTIIPSLVVGLLAIGSTPFNMGMKGTFPSYSEILVFISSPLAIAATMVVGIAIVWYGVKNILQRLNAAKTQTDLEKLGAGVVSAVLAEASGESVDLDQIEESVKAVLDSAKESRDIAYLGSNPFLQVADSIKAEELMPVLRAEFKKQSDGKFTEEQIERAATEVIYEASGTHSLSEQLGAVQLNENSLVGVVLDSKGDVKASAEAAIAEFRKAAGHENATLGFTASHLTEGQEIEIRELAQGLKVEFRTDKNLFMKSEENGNIHDLNPIVLESLLQSFDAKRFTSYGLIIPETLMTDLTRMMGVISADSEFIKEKSILYQATIILMDKDFQARPSMKFRNLEQIQRVAHMIAEQA